MLLWGEECGIAPLARKQDQNQIGWIATGNLLNLSYPIVLMISKAEVLDSLHNTISLHKLNLQTHSHTLKYMHAFIKAYKCTFKKDYNFLCMYKVIKTLF